MSWAVQEVLQLVAVTLLALTQKNTEINASIVKVIVV